MSRESMDWLNKNVLVGFTQQRGERLGPNGHAWHWREGADNHYPGAIPVEEVQRRLFNWKAVERPVLIPVETGNRELIEAGLIEPEVKYIEVPNKKAIVHEGADQVFGIFADGYKIHQYEQWLLSNVATLLHGELGIGSAGLLRDGAQAWVQVEVPETFQTPSGFRFRPDLTAATSLNGSIATIYKLMVTAVVCDNTLGAGLMEPTPEVKVKHSRNSLAKYADVRSALELIERDATTFSEDVEKLLAVKVSDHDFGKIMDEVLCKPLEPGAAPFARTKWETKRNVLTSLYATDLRVAPWAGTGFGVLQLANTYRQHYQTVKGAQRAERAMINAISGETETADRKVVQAILELAA